MSFEARNGMSENLPDKKVSVRETFKIDMDMEVPAFSEPNEYVPDFDPDYLFDKDTTLALLAGGNVLRALRTAEATAAETFAGGGLGGGRGCARRWDRRIGGAPPGTTGERRAAGLPLQDANLVNTPRRVAEAWVSEFLDEPVDRQVWDANLEPALAISRATSVICAGSIPHSSAAHSTVYLEYTRRSTSKNAS